MRESSARLLVLLSLLFSLAGCSSGSSPEIVPAKPVLYSYREVFGRELKAWVFPPAKHNSLRSAILLFHGGGWSEGSPEWTFDAAQRFAKRGMVAVSVEYRLSKGSVTPIDALADACASFRWVRENADRFGIDPTKVAGYGVSAGAHLATSAATVGCPEEGNPAISPEPNLLLLWSPALDLQWDGWFAKKLLNQAPAADYSPVEHVRPKTPPTSIVIGARDTLTPLVGSQRFCERLSQQGVTCELNTYEEVGHLLTRNLANQESDFDPDPELVAAGIASQVRFLEDHGFIDE